MPEDMRLFMARPTGKRRFGHDVVTDTEIYKDAWEIYRKDPFETALRDGLGISRQTAKILVEEGVPALGMPPLRQKVKAALKLATQLDVEESAKYIALGRGSVRIGITKFAKAIQDLMPHEIPKHQIVPQLCALVMLNEKLSRIEKGEEEPDFTEADLAETLSSLLTSVVSKRLPGGAKLMDHRIVIDMEEGGDVATVRQIAGPEAASEPQT
jgi:hypothetical protein